MSSLLYNLEGCKRCSDEFEERVSDAFVAINLVFFFLKKEKSCFQVISLDDIHIHDKAV